MISSILAILAKFLGSAFGTSLLSYLAGWLFPSPLQKAATDQAEIHNAETRAQDSGGDVTGLDHLP